MKIGLGFRSELGSIPGGQWIIEQFDSIIARISGVWRVEHKDNGEHGDIIADSVTTGSLTLDDNFSATALRARDSILIGSPNPSQPGVLLTQTSDELVVRENDAATNATINAFRGVFLPNSGTGAYVRTNALHITDGMTAPSTAAGYAVIYVDTADGDLKVKFGDGTVKTIVTDT